ncbi:unnamed protein product [Rangifer tarandus platyrhynchus]|uniref:Uncharacterized protein n=2 Tax=Rangifer tarandus platyrhynchus TaxID=3082113 RepID=A0ABN8Y011_RANTA|nr:unnamed protein product [Rangifer tarandus platyrhynchus]
MTGQCQSTTHVSPRQALPRGSSGPPLLALSWVEPAAPGALSREGQLGLGPGHQSRTVRVWSAHGACEQLLSPPRLPPFRHPEVEVTVSHDGVQLTREKLGKDSWRY